MSQFTGPEPCVPGPNQCSCMGHRIPGVHHFTACCKTPHIDDLDPEEFCPTCFAGTDSSKHHTTCERL